MEKKKWEEYTKEEKCELLTHTFYYYGKLMFSLADFEDYQKLCEKRADDVFKTIVLGFVMNAGGPTLILNAIHAGKAEELLSSYKDVVKTYHIEKEFEDYCEGVLVDIVKTFKNPEPAIPLSEEQIIDSIEGITGSSRK